MNLKPMFRVRDSPLFFILSFAISLSTFAFVAYNLVPLISLFCFPLMLLALLHKRANTPIRTFSNHGIFTLISHHPRAHLYLVMKMIMTMKSAARMGGRLVNEILSFLVFSVLDVADVILCYVYKVADFFIEAEWKSCYCSSTAKEIIAGRGKIVVSEAGDQSKKIVRLTCTKLHLEEISDTLYTRPSLVSAVSTSTSIRRGSVRSSFTVNSTIMEMLQGRIGGQQKLPIPRWSDCNCKTCTSWTASSCRDTLFVKVDGARGEQLSIIPSILR